VSPSAGLPERVRLFAALELPLHAREALERWSTSAIRDLPALRRISGDALHVTLCFLGWRAANEIEEIGEACAVAVATRPAPELSLAEPVWLPERRPRVLAVRLHDPSGALARLQAALVTALSGGGWYAPEARPFLAHVTAARVPRGARVRPAALACLPPVAFSGAGVTLYRSHLGSAGARYEALRTVPFDGASSSPAPASIDPLAVVRAFHREQNRAYAGGELDALRPWLADDVIWHVPGRSQIAGEHRGVEAVLAYFDIRRRLTDETFRVSVRGLSVVGERVVQLAGGSADRDGSSVRWETVGVFRVAGGRIAECWLVPFDLYEFDRIWR
jgi:2'-5' RNA ligase